MLSFDELTNAGRVERLRQLARTCLVQHYGAVRPRVQVISVHSFNTIFRFEADQGPSALRIGDAIRIHPPAVEDVEAVWLRALADDGVAKLRTLPTLDGANWTTAKLAEIPEARVCTRFTWVPGERVLPDGNLAAARDAGRLPPFLDGYRSVRPLPDLHPDTLATLAAARSLNIMNLGLLAPNSRLSRTFDDHAARVGEWMRAR